MAHRCQSEGRVEYLNMHEFFRGKLFVLLPYVYVDIRGECRSTFLPHEHDLVVSIQHRVQPSFCLSCELSERIVSWGAPGTYFEKED